MKRYNYEYCEDAPHDSGLEEDVKGRYVKYSDVKALQERLEELQKMQVLLLSKSPKIVLRDYFDLQKQLAEAEGILKEIKYNLDLEPGKYDLKAFGFQIHKEMAKYFGKYNKEGG